jgi:hypothetical protein
MKKTATNSSELVAIFEERRVQWGEREISDWASIFDFSRLEIVLDLTSL